MTFDIRVLPTETAQAVWARPCRDSLGSENRQHDYVPALIERCAR